MSNKNEKKDKIIAAAKKMVENKKAMIAYSNGKITKDELREQGIKLAMPI
ncbi:MAG: hypothetical protein KDC92_07505 [Bacteroidetes bacterium]|nr:hypothetical protein [Bacteroidota bacterium]